METTRQIIHANVDEVFDKIKKKCGDDSVKRGRYDIGAESPDYTCATFRWIGHSLLPKS